MNFTARLFFFYINYQIASVCGYVTACCMMPCISGHVFAYCMAPCISGCVTAHCTVASVCHCVMVWWPVFVAL